MSTGAIFWVVAFAAVAALAIQAFRQREALAVDARLCREAPGQFIDLACGRTHVFAEGPDEGPLVVLVPGATLPLWIWRELPAHLVGTGHRVVRYDLLGRGYSSRPRVAYDCDLFDAQLEQVLATQAPGRRVHLVGLAFGGLIAAEYARRHPNQVASLALLGADGFGVSMTAGDRVKQWPVIGDLLLRLFGNRRLMARLDGYTNDASVLRWLRERYSPELMRKGFKRALLSSVRHMPIHDARILYRALDRSTLPMLALWGNDDRITPAPSSAVLAQTFTRSPVHRFAGIGHLPHVERLEETSRLLIQLFKQGNPR